MMRGSKHDVPVAMEVDEGVIRMVEWGGMSVELSTFRNGINPAPFFKGLPDDRCQCPHWGYVVQGQVRYQFADHEEVYHAGDVYYAPPGHTPSYADNTEFVEFSPADQLQQTMEVVERNLAAMQQ